MWGMAPSAVGIDIGGTKLLMIAQGSEGGEPLVRRAATGAAATGEEVEAAIRGFVADHQLAPTSLGIAVPGLVADGRVSDCDVVPALTGWRGPTGLGVPPVLVHDIRSALAEEAADLPESSTAVVVLCGTAVG